MWDKSYTRYAAASTVNTIYLLMYLINTRYESGKDLGDYIAEPETYCNKLAVVELSVIEERQFAVSLVFVMNGDYLKSTVTALRAVDDDKTTWTVYTIAFFRNIVRSKWSIAAIYQQKILRELLNVKREENQSCIHCYNCNRLGHVARNCKADKTNPMISD